MKKFWLRWAKTIWTEALIDVHSWGSLFFCKTYLWMIRFTRDIGYFLFLWVKFSTTNLPLKQLSWPFYQGWGAGAGCFWLLGAGAAWEKNEEPEPLEKKPGAGAAWEKKSGAGAGKKFAGSPALPFMHSTCWMWNVYNWVREDLFM